MKMFVQLESSLRVALLLSVAGILQGCAGRHAVVAVTGTTIGVEISENPQTQLYQAKLGYNRAETAIVPSNRSATKDVTTSNSMGDGAADTTDVLMELRYSGIFSTGSNSGIYQRLAVGSNAVKQPGATLMMARDASGNLPDKVAENITRSLSGTPTAQPLSIADKKQKIVEIRSRGGAEQTRVDTAVKNGGFRDWNDFVSGPNQPTDAQLDAILKELNGQ